MELVLPERSNSKDAAEEMENIGSSIIKEGNLLLQEIKFLCICVSHTNNYIIIHGEQPNEAFFRLKIAAPMQFMKLHTPYFVIPRTLRNASFRLCLFPASTTTNF